MRFLALSVSDAAEDVIAVIRAGARGYVTKTISGEELTTAIEQVANGDAVFSPRLAGFVLDAFRAGDRVGGDTDLDELTPREREVLQLIARGYMYKEIAAAPPPVGEDGREPRLERAPQAAAVDETRARALGDRAPADLTRRQTRLLPSELAAVRRVPRAARSGDADRARSRRDPGRAPDGTRRCRSCLRGR